MLRNKFKKRNKTIQRSGLKLPSKQYKIKGNNLSFESNKFLSLYFNLDSTGM
jgi:hypothetical protein